MWLGLQSEPDKRSIIYRVDYFALKGSLVFIDTIRMISNIALFTSLVTRSAKRVTVVYSLFELISHLPWRVDCAKIFFTQVRL